MRLTDRVLSLHPAAITGLFVALFLGGGLATNVFPFGSIASLLMFAITMLVMIAPMWLWFYSLYRAASARSDQFVGHSGRRGFLFLSAILGLCAFLALFPTMMSIPPTAPIYRTVVAALTISMLVGSISYFASVWAAANALVRFDEHQRHAEFHKTLGTFFLLAYLPIGIWWVHPRIKRLLVAPSSSELVS
ncbi:MAG: hypothetical protein JNM47_06620 [Hyphomonadaceae bacterium]|nr:hypothetical protein [Hyphomonadaceae bacterium]